ncbi:hypothetical protein [Pseudomonas marginalis]|uniref:hypothetical protein n=1 Tax=Pseudomonas fluorescens group TaxID=136843 RepID=UPI001F36D952|nr:hypothetical protein [Pseudomonas marginalis]MCF5668766.1 hypothetical protein [Pseudomonas marginalis]
MTEKHFIKVSFDKHQLSEIKTQAVRGRGCSERISFALACRLLNLSSQSFSLFHILDEIDYLEGVRPISKTKREEQFKKTPLFPFWHKHVFSTRHLIRNLRIRWGMVSGGNRDLDKLFDNVAKQNGEDPNAWPSYLVNQLVIGGFEQRSARGLTGDWLIYAKYENRNYYLDLAAHEEGVGDEANALMHKLRKGCQAEFPFLFE